MRVVSVLGLLLLSFLFYCGDVKAETADNICFVTLDAVKEKMAAKEEFFLLLVVWIMWIRREVWNGLRL